MGKIWAFCAALLFFACAGSDPATTASQAAPGTDSHWVTLPGTGSVVILGVSEHLSRREAEIDAARENAARKAAMYHGIYATVENVQNIGGAYSLDYYAASDVDLEFDRELEKYMEKLVFDETRDVRRTSDDRVFVRFSYPAAFSGNITYHFAKNADGSPGWTRNRPREINGFPAGVGFSGRQWRIGDTFNKSCDSAAAAIASQLSAEITSRDTTSENRNTQTILQKSSGRLDRFLVLETWIDPATRGVWTLAVAGNAE